MFSSFRTSESGAPLRRRKFAIGEYNGIPDES
jgi:hypothetical protein